MLRALVLDDEFLFAMTMEDILQDCGIDNVVTVGTVEAAMIAIDTGFFDVAVLDVNLFGETSAAVAARLEREHVPFFFISGSNPNWIRDLFKDHGFLMKPAHVDDIQRQVAIEIGTH